MCFSVVVIRVVVQRNCQRSDRGDLEDRAFNTHRVVRVGCGFSCDADRILAHFLSRFAAQAVHRGNALRRYASNLRRQFRIGLRVVVILLGLVLRNNRYRYRVDRQRAKVFRLDIVVVRICGPPCDFVVIRTASGVYATANGFDCRGLIVLQVFQLRRVFRQCSSVVILCGRGC